MPPKKRSDRNSAIDRKTRTDSDAMKQAEQWVRERIYGLSDDEVRWLVKEYISTYKRMLNSLHDLVGEGRMRPAQLVKLLTDIEREVNALTGRLNGHLDPAMLDAFRQGYYGRAWLMDQLTVAEWGTTFNVLLPSEQIRAMLLQDYIGVSDWIELERAELVTRIKKQLTSSMIAGEGMAQAAQRLRRTLGVQAGQRSEFKGSAWRVLLITRTEIMRASNLGALTVYEQNQDILNGYEYVATKDERTCPICGGLDGKVFRFGAANAVMPPSDTHPGCRCTVIPVLRDQELQNRVAGVRQTYAEWAAMTGIMSDGGLADQRGADAHAINRTSA